jgi:hypothetical protein
MILLGGPILGFGSIAGLRNEQGWWKGQKKGGCGSQEIRH